MFHGDGRAEENPYDFLKSIQTSFDNKPGITEEEKCERLYLHCKSDFDAEEWYDNLPQADKTSWAALGTAFRLRWPRRAKVQKTPEQKKAELFAQTLDDGTMLDKEEIGGTKVYHYIAWADRVDRLSTALGDTQGFLVSVMRDALPKALRNVIGVSHTDWTTFTAAVRNVSHTALQSAIEDENRIRALEAATRQALVQSPTAAIRQSLNRTHIATQPPSPTPQRNLQRFTPTTTPSQPDIFAGGGPARTRLFAYQSSSSQPANPAQRALVPQSAYRDPKVRLLDLLRNLLTHHPDTETGHTAYRTQVEAWHRKNGQYPHVTPDEYKPYPLTPGTQPVSSGACFNCGGRHGDVKHMAFECPVKKLPGSVPAAERAFRSIAAVCYGLIRGPTAPTAVRTLDVAEAIDVTNANEDYVRSLIDGGAYITEINEEGKEYGLSN
jgi:hypothetical protein